MIFGDYLRDMPEGENGSVIVGMFVVIPIICFLSQILFWLIFITFQKLIRWCKLAYNKRIKSDSTRRPIFCKNKGRKKTPNLLRILCGRYIL
jgi:hypothetical protein